MIPVALLAGGALFFVLWVVFGQPIVIALATALVFLVCIGVWSDVRRYHHDRDTAVRRLKKMRLADTMRFLLGPRPPRG